jgi:hypothetical protein
MMRKLIMNKRQKKKAMRKLFNPYVIKWHIDNNRSRKFRKTNFVKTKIRCSRYRKGVWSIIDPEKILAYWEQFTMEEHHE